MGTTIAIIKSEDAFQVCIKKDGVVVRRFTYLTYAAARRAAGAWAVAHDNCQIVDGMPERKGKL